MSRRSNSLPLRYSICIVSEGEKTENNFFNKLYKYEKSCNPDLPYTMQTVPPPVDDEDGDKDDAGRKSGTLDLKGSADSVVDEYKGVSLPMKWVKMGIALTGTFDEVWIAFDKDGHPAAKEAFEEFLKARAKDKRLNLVFSSRCFEYYMLQHFEYLYHGFEKSECNEKVSRNKGKTTKTVYLRCCTDQAKQGACDGDIGNTANPPCINGYARKKGYWLESKNDMAFDVVHNIYAGIVNSHNIKWKSLSSEDVAKPVYERNPYLNTYRLTARLMMLGVLEHGDKTSINKGSSYSYDMERVGNTLVFKNNFPGTMDLERVSIYVYDELYSKEKFQQVLLKHTNVGRIMASGDTKTVDMTPFFKSPSQYAIIDFYGNRFLFMAEQEIDKVINKELFHLTSSLNIELEK
jgi:hypothetical protein